jgi:hypothetical protein
MKYRGNLVAAPDIQGSGMSKPPKNLKKLVGPGHLTSDAAVAGGEIVLRDDNIRTPAEDKAPPGPSRSTKVMSSLPGKVMRGKGGKGKGMKMTAAQAAACLGSRKRG